MQTRGTRSVCSGLDGMVVIARTRAERTRLLANSSHLGSHIESFSSVGSRAVVRSELAPTSICCSRSGLVQLLGLGHMFDWVNSGWQCESIWM